jgi:hypothetical protein
MYNQAVTKIFDGGTPLAHHILQLACRTAVPEAGVFSDTPFNLIFINERSFV